jgi:hypothetical protein
MLQGDERSRSFSIIRLAHFDAAIGPSRFTALQFDHTSHFRGGECPAVYKTAAFAAEPHRLGKKLRPDWSGLVEQQAIFRKKRS